MRRRVSSSLCALGAVVSLLGVPGAAAAPCPQVNDPTGDFSAGGEVTGEPATDLTAVAVGRAGRSTALTFVVAKLPEGGPMLGRSYVYNANVRVGGADYGIQAL